MPSSDGGMEIGMKEKVNLKDIFNKNLVLILIIQVLSDCANNWSNSFMNMGAKAAGISVGAIGLAASVYTIAALIMRMPAGTIADSDKKKIALIIAITLRSICFFFLGTFGMSGNTNYIIARALHGICWSLVGIILPAVVAMMMDKKVMGTTYAFLTVAQNLTKNYSKAAGIKVYQTFGIVPSLCCATGFAVAAIILICFLDFNDSRIIQATAKKKKKGVINMKYIPACFMMSMAVFGWTTFQQYNSVLAETRAIDIASIMVITGTIASVVGFATNAACDFIHAKYVLFFLYVCLGVGLLLTSHAYTYSAFLVAEILCTIGASYSKVINIYLFKNCDVTEKGSVHATNYFATDILSAIAGVVTGTILTKFDYESGYMIIGIFGLAVAVVFILFGSKLMNFSSQTETAKEGE